MPNRGTHAVIGLTSTLAWEAKRADTDGQDDYALARVGLGTFASIAPDLIEPALSPRHRKFAHSILVCASLIYLVSRLCSNGPQRPVHRFLSTMAVGYLSHLGADLWTAAGLPLCGFALKV